MAKLTLMPSGINASVPNRGNKSRGQRGQCTGWSKGACQRNARFLRSVDPAALPSFGLAMTLTVRDLPSSPREWARLRDVFLKRLRAQGASLYHWVTEWTKRGVPHLHVVAFFPQPAEWLAFDITDAWIDLAGYLGSDRPGQLARPVTRAAGWFEYTAKHSARGVAHYQRQTASLPPSWASVGRVWGKGGDWPVSETETEVSKEGFHTFRRLVRSYLVSKARTDLARERRYGKPDRIDAAVRRVRFCRTMLRCPKKGLSTVRGLGHWMPLEAQHGLLAALPDARGGPLRPDQLAADMWGRWNGVWDDQDDPRPAPTLP